MIERGRFVNTIYWVARFTHLRSFQKLSGDYVYEESTSSKNKLVDGQWKRLKYNFRLRQCSRQRMHWFNKRMNTKLIYASKYNFGRLYERSKHAKV